MNTGVEQGIQLPDLFIACARRALLLLIGVHYSSKGVKLKGVYFRLIVIIKIIDCFPNPFYL